MKTLKLLLALVVMASTLQAAPQKELKLALLDVNKISSESKASKALQVQIKKIRTEVQEVIDSTEKALRKEEQEVVSAKSKLKPEQFQKKQKAFQDKVMSLQKWVAARNEELQRETHTAMEKMREKVVDISQSYAKENGISMIVPAGVPVYVSSDVVDITENVVAKFNKELPELKITVTTKYKA